MAIEAATQRYWAMSAHLKSLKTDQDRENFYTFVLGPTIEHSTDQHEVRLLSKLLPQDQQATG